MTRFFRKELSALCGALAVAPLFVLIGAMRAPEAVWPWLLWPALAAVVAAAAGSLPGRWRLAGGAVGLALLALGAALWMPPALWLSYGPLCAVFYGLVLWRARTAPFEEWSTALLMVGGFVHILCMMAARGLEVPWVYPVQRWLLLAYMPVLLVLGNRLALDVGASGRDGRRPTRRIRRGNVRLAVLASALVLLLANLGAIRDGFYAVFLWVRDGIARAMAWLAGLLASEEEIVGAGGGGDGMMGMEEMAAGEASPFWVFLERVLGWVAMILLVAGLAYALYRLAKYLRVAIRRLTARLRDAARLLGEGVQDRTESILDWEEVRGAARERVRSLRARLARPPRWEDMDARARVRWTFAVWRRGRPGRSPGETARDALRAAEAGEEMAAIYERARYSEMKIAVEEAEFMREAAKKAS